MDETAGARRECRSSLSEELLWGTSLVEASRGVEIKGVLAGLVEVCVCRRGTALGPSKGRRSKARRMHARFCAS